MDAGGWIPIPLLASFNRVKTLTYDVQLVRDVLTLSALVEVRADWVRMHRWQQWVLPDAPPSPLDDAPPLHPPVPGDSAHYREEEAEGEGEEEEEEDDVEFVLGGDAGQSWTPERKVEA